MAAKMRREVVVQPKRGRRAGPARFERGGSLDALNEVPPPSPVRMSSADHGEWRTRRAREIANHAALRAAEERVLRAVVAYVGATSRELEEHDNDLHGELWNAGEELRRAQYRVSL